MRTYDEWKSTEPDYDDEAPDEIATDREIARIEAESLRRRNNPVGVLAAPEELAAIWPLKRKECRVCWSRDAGPGLTRCAECRAAAVQGATR